LAANYEEGCDYYLQRVMRPTFRSLVHLRAPVWSATEQRGELEGWVEGASKQPTLVAALTEYDELCGYLPLCSELSAREVARRWMEEHPKAGTNWDEISSWANSRGTPFAWYHAVTIALDLPTLRPPAGDGVLWDHVLAILGTGEPADGDGGPRTIWALYCELACHFARHIEALHPGQDGERAACYAWWLARKVGQIFGENVEQANLALEQIVRPEQSLSFSRWSIARSPITPSRLRYATLFTRSPWALSLLVRLDCAANQLSISAIPEECRVKLGAILGGFFVGNPAQGGDGSTRAVFAIDEESGMTNLLKENGVLAPESRETLLGMKRVWCGMTDVSQLRSLLERLAELDADEQHLIMLFLRAAIFSTSRFDDVISEWLGRTADLVEALRRGPESVLELLVEGLAELQQRPRVDWPIRLPHFLAYGSEQTEERNRFEILHIHTLLMSINGGIVSPIQRMMCSKWQSESLARLRVWRENIIEVAKHSEPWVAARVRATSAAISRLIGPRPSASMLIDQVDPVESDEGEGQE
jgi:hypothetical protein